MKLKDAFKIALNTRGLLVSKGYNRYQVGNMKRNLQAGKVSIELMQRVVRDAGYKCVREEQWE